MKIKLVCLFALVLALMLGSTALAMNVAKPGEDFYYLDTANVLSTEAEGIIYFCNRELQEQTGAQIVVAALDGIDDADTYDYAYEMFNEWGIGSAEENNGFLLLMAIEEDDYFALPGTGVDGIFASSELNDMFDEYLEPDFAKKNYEAGALKFFEAVLDRYAEYYNLDIGIADGEAAYEQFMAANTFSGNFGGARSGGGGYAYGGTDHGGYYDPYYEDEFDFIDLIIAMVVLIVIMSMLGALSKSRGGSFFWPIFFFGPGRHHHHYHHHHHGHHNRRPPHGPGGFGGGAGRSGGGFGGSFGGGRGGGGSSFGGGAGRGRH